jgi:serine/threonine protein phosphatase PrpC
MSSAAEKSTFWAEAHGEQAIGARSSQQDSLDAAWLPGETEAAQARLLMVLADGMGGHAGGDIASILAVNAFMATAQMDARMASQALLEKALKAAGSALFEKAAAEPALHDMGTTLIGVIVQKSGAGFEYNMVSVGDSPLWVWHAGEERLERANASHSLAGELAREVALGHVSPEQASRDPRASFSNVLTSALLASSENEYTVDATAAARPLAKDDLVILSSDGLDTLNPSELSVVIRKACRAKSSTQKTTRNLIAAVIAKRDEQQDNVSVLAARMGAPPKTRAGLFGLFS